MSGSHEANRAGARKIVEAFFDTKERRDFTALTELFADDIVCMFPLNAMGTQDRWFVYNGKQETNNHQKATLERFSPLRMFNKQFTTSHDGSVVFVESQGDYLTNDGRHDRNVHVFKFVIKHGLIPEVFEYANPVTFALLANLPIGNRGVQ